MPKIRGATFHSLLVAVRSTRGAEAEAKTRAALPPALLENLRSGKITQGGWYAIEDYAAMHVAIDELFHGGDEYAAELGRVSTEHDMSGVIGFMLSITSPQLLFRYASLVLAAYFRNVTFETTKLSSCSLRLETKGMTGGNRLMQAELGGGSCLLLQRTGVRNPRVLRLEMTSTCDGLLEFEWDE